MVVNIIHGYDIIEILGGGGGVPRAPPCMKPYIIMYMHTRTTSLCLLSASLLNDSGRVVGVRLNSYEKDMALHRITDEFANFTPSVGTQFYECSFNLKLNDLLKLHMIDQGMIIIYTCEFS